jgi:hypothetical protein
MIDGILTPLQQQVLEHLFADEWFRRYFYLTGGTALSAFYLGHRYSDDLDLFTHQQDLVPVDALFRRRARDLKLRANQLQRSPGFLRYEIDEQLQVDLVADVPSRVGSPELIDAFMVDSLENIAVNKVTAILGRCDPKDYVDLYYLLTEQDLDIHELLRLGRLKDAGLETFTWASLLEYVDRIAILPRMIRQLDPAALRSFFHRLRDSLLDSIKPQ